MRVLIIGGGLGGLTCARELRRSGVDVMVLEASDGVGGRVRSDRFQGYILDRGFQVLFDAYPAVKRQLDLARLNLRPFEPGAIICAGGQRITLTDPLRDPNLRDRLTAITSLAISPLDKLRTLQLALELRGKTVEQVLAGADTTSIAFLRQRGFSDRIIDRFFRPFYGGVLFDRELLTSAKCLKFDFKMLADGQTAIPAQGMGQISDQLAAPLFEEGIIALNTRVAQLCEERGCITGVRLDNGELHHADAVVIATAAPEAAQLSELPMPKGAKQAMTLYFSGAKPFYTAKKLLLNADPAAFVNNAQLITNIAPTYAPSGKHLLSAVIMALPGHSDAELYKHALRDLHQMFHGDLQAQATIATYQPLRIYKIPFAQFDQPPGIHPALPNNRTARRGLYFAAEFTEASSLNAAMISGEKCAAALLGDAI